MTVVFSWVHFLAMPSIVGYNLLWKTSMTFLDMAIFLDFDHLMAFWMTKLLFNVYMCIQWKCALHNWDSSDFWVMCYRCQSTLDKLLNKHASFFSLHPSYLGVGMLCVWMLPKVKTKSSEAPLCWSSVLLFNSTCCTLDNTCWLVQSVGRT